MLMGDMGAEVIKIEEPTGGDETRKWTPFVNGESTQFLTFNRNKRSLSINLKEPEGLKIVQDLAADADVMIESFRAGTLDRLGLGYEAIKKTNPGLVYCSISGYGRTGPMADMPGYDLLIQAYSGLMSLTGDPEGSPLRIGFSLVDLFTGMMAYGTILTALRQRDQTGHGQWVESALLDGQVAALSYHATGFMGTGVEPKRMGSGHPSLVPYQAFTSSNGQFIIGCANQGLWERMCAAIGQPGMVDDPRYITNTDRVDHRAECVGELSAIFATNTTDHWVDLIVAAGVPCGPINTVAEVVSNPQVLARNMITTVDHPKVPQLRFPGSPLKLTDSPATVRRVPPMLGQHNDEILQEAGYSAEKIADFKQRGVIGE
jgi:crotonobetainyl-CoA:carnitine CoA-transferase CaiB-like acyl-CoA transferase